MKRTFFLLLLLLVNCVRVNLSSDSPATVIHKLDYSSPDTGQRAFQNTVRVFDFSASNEYDRKSFVLVMEDGTVQRTSYQHWAAKPPIALPDLLHRDLLAEGAFPTVLRRGVVGGNEIVVEGFLREFGARETADYWLGVLDVDLLMRCSGRPKGDQQKTYRLSAVMPGEGYTVMAQTLSSLVQEWSEAARFDIRAFIDVCGEREPPGWP